MASSRPPKRATLSVTNNVVFIPNRARLVMQYNYFKSVILGMCLLVAGVACGDNKLISQQDGEIQPETEESLRAWVDGQDMIIAPWSHEIDGEEMDRVIIEDDRLLFDDNSGNEWLLGIQENDIIHGNSMVQMFGMLRRVESTERNDGKIILNTRMADLEELFLKLNSGTEINELTYSQPLKNNSDSQPHTHKGAKDDLSTFEQELGIYMDWVINPTTLVNINKPYEKAICGSRKTGEAFKVELCNLNTFGFTEGGGGGEPPVGTVEGVEAGIGFKTNVVGSVIMNGGRLAINIEYGVEKEKTQAACLLRNYSYLDAVHAFIASKGYHDNLPEGHFRGLTRDMIRNIQAACGALKPELFNYERWLESYKNEELARLTREHGSASAGLDALNRLELNHYLGPIRWYNEIRGFLNEIVGKRNFLKININMDVGLALDPFHFYIFGEYTSKQIFTVPVRVKVDSVTLVGPVLMKHTIELKPSVQFSGKVQGGLGVSGENAPRLNGNIKFGLTWTPEDGFDYEFDLTDSGSRLLPGDWEYFGELGLDLTLNLPVSLTETLYETAGAEVIAETYFKTEIGSSINSGSSNQNVCSAKSSVGMKMKLAGILAAPLLGELSRLEGLLFDTCNPSSPNALIPSWVVEPFKQWLCSEFIYVENTCPKDNLDGNYWIVAQVGHFVDDRRQPETADSMSGPVLDVDHIMLRKKGTNDFHYPIEVKGVPLDPLRLKPTVETGGEENQNARFYDLNMQLQASGGGQVCGVNGTLENRDPTDAEWKGYGLSLNDGDVAAIKFPVKIELGDELILQRQLYGWCLGGGSATLSVGNDFKSQYGAAKTDLRFVNNRTISLTVKGVGECAANDNTSICLPTAN